MLLEDRRRNSLAESFKLNAELETLLTNELKRPGTIAQLKAQERLRIGHYKDQRTAYLDVHGKLPERQQ